jgi:hypothetical protein
MSKKNGKAPWARGRGKPWWVVASLFRTEIADPPRVIDADYDPDGMLVEQRVVLIRARSHRKALRKGRSEADKYCSKHVNSYGQRVVWRRLKVLYSGPLFWAPGDGREVWSMTTVAPSSTTDKELETRLFGPDESKETLSRRKKYFNREWSGDVGLDPSDGGSA